MKTRLYAEVVAMTCLITVAITFIYTTINGLNTGHYTALINTNAYGEHWFELVFIFIGVVIYVISFNDRIEFTRKKHLQKQIDNSFKNEVKE